MEYTASTDKPVTYTKGKHTRQATTPGQQAQLEYAGWRRADAPPVERGVFLPAPTTVPPTAMPSAGGTSQGGQASEPAADSGEAGQSSAPTSGRKSK